METQTRPPQALRSFLARFLAAVRKPSTHVSATARYDHSTNSILLRYKTPLPATESVELSDSKKPPCPLIKPGRQNACASTLTVAIAATALAVLAELSDTNKLFSATKSLPLPNSPPSTRAKLSPAQSPPRTAVREQPTPAPDTAPGACPERSRRARIPLPKAPPEALSQMSHCDIPPATKMSQMSHFCVICGIPRYEKMSHSPRIWPASTMSQMSHFSATKTRF